MSNLNNPIFQDATKARKWLEALLWADGRACGYCGTVDESTPIKGRMGYYQCNACRKQFTIMVGTVFERSHIPLNKWLLAAFLLCASKKGVSAHQMHRMLGITYKSAWFMMHRLREAMRDTDPSPLGGEGKTIEADETFIGQEGYTFVTGKGWVPIKGQSGKMKVLTLIERGGKSRSVKVDSIRAKDLRPAIVKNVSRKSRLITDEAKHYVKIGREFNKHESVNHSEYEWVRGDVTTNTVESFFALFKRGMRGTYQHCSESHLQRYLHEFDFRYSNREALGVDDAMRTHAALKGIQGKRLTYRRTNEAANA